jgi:vitamin B12 transporter
MNRNSRLTAGLLALALLCPARPGRAETSADGEGGDVFLTLTRSAEPAEKMPSNVSVVTAAEIERAGARTLNDALELLPSVDVQKTPSLGQKGSLRLRGVPTSNQVQVVVDDQPLGGVYLQDLDTGQISVQDIERIEVVRGGGSVLYGANAVGGVVHIITKKASAGPATSSAGFEAGAFRTMIQKADLRRRDGKADMALSGASYHTDGFQGNSDGSGLSATGSAGWSFDNGARVSVEASRTDNESGVPGGTLVPFAQWNGHREQAPADPDSRVRNASTLGRLRGAFPVGNASVETVFYGSNGDYDFTNPFFTVVQDKNILGNDTRVHLPGKWLVGASYERDELLSEGTAKNHGVDWGLYAQKTWTAGKLELIPALRLDQHGTFGNILNPRLTVVLRPSASFKVSANAGRSFRSPTLVDLNQSFPANPLFFSGAFLANKQLKPETAWTYDLGIEAGRFGVMTAALTGYYTRLTDRIVATANPYPADNTLINAPRAEMSGVELEVKGRWGVLTQHGSYTYQRSLGNSLTSSHYVPLLYAPRHLADYQATVEGPHRWRLTNGVQYVHRQFDQDGEKGHKLPSYALWNARLEKDILGARLYVAADNLLNRRYTDSTNFGVYVPQPGRTFLAGVTIRFAD